MNLFMSGKFTLRSGKESAWKIECDALTGDDWAGLAAMAAEILPPWNAVLGVPRGGIPFACALAKYQTHNAKHPTLIAEDVCTTGGSMQRYVTELFDAGTLTPKTPLVGVCVFARELDWPYWCIPLFAFHPRRLMEKVAEDIARLSNPETN